MAARGGVHVSYLVVALVICLGLIGFVVSQNSEITDHVLEKEKLNKALQSRSTELSNANREIEAARLILIGTKDEKPKYDDWTQRVKEGGELLTAAREGGATLAYGSVQDLLNDVYNVIKEKVALAKTEATLRSAKDAELNQANAAREATRTELENGQRELRAQLEALQVRLEKQQQEYTTELAKVRSDSEAVIDEKDAKISDEKRRGYILENRNKKLEERVSVLEREIRKERTFEDVEPDGEVIEVSNQLGYAWINLGKEDRLTRGVVFNVYAEVQGGRKLRKGKVEVIEVDKDIAKVAIQSTTDLLNPIAETDKIASPFYNRNEAPVFVLAGDKLTTTRLSIAELERKIAEYGGVIASEVTHNTTYLVALSGYQASPHYDIARKLGITILREDELLGFMDY